MYGNITPVTNIESDVINMIGKDDTKLESPLKSHSSDMFLEPTLGNCYRVDET